MPATLSAKRVRSRTPWYLHAAAQVGLGLGEAESVAKRFKGLRANTVAQQHVRVCVAGQRLRCWWSARVEGSCRFCCRPGQPGVESFWLPVSACIGTGIGGGPRRALSLLPVFATTSALALRVGGPGVLRRRWGNRRTAMLPVLQPARALGRMGPPVLPAPVSVQGQRVRALRGCIRVFGWAGQPACTSGGRRNAYGAPWRGGTKVPPGLGCMIGAHMKDVAKKGSQLRVFEAYRRGVRIVPCAATVGRAAPAEEARRYATQSASTHAVCAPLPCAAQ